MWHTVEHGIEHFGAISYVRQYTEDEETTKLKALLQIPEKPKAVFTCDNKKPPMKLQSCTSNTSQPSNKNKSEEVKPESDLDSDDDFEPHDGSNDTAVRAEKAPLYIRDCMEGECDLGFLGMDCL